MGEYKKILGDALNRLNKPKLDESLVYPEGLTERMHPDLERELVEKKHSLGQHPAIPEGDESSYEQKIMGERFNEVVNRYKRNHECDTIDNEKLILGMMPIVHESMAIEAKHKRRLEELAERMVREEYNMGKDIVEIHAELTPNITLMPEKKNKTPMPVEMEFENHAQMTNARDEVYKRRFLNAMTQGAAKKCNHMFHMVDEELTNMDPRLPSRYAKMMSAADYMYYVIPKMENGVTGGVVKVVFPNKKNPKAQIYVQAMVFPVLIHELVKGVMELLSAHGLPKDKNVGNYVLNKADYLEAEPWDMRLGPALWGKFTEAIGADNFDLKHHIYSEMAALPVNEFNMKMREVLAGTKEGKNIMTGLVNEIRQGLQEDEFNEAMTKMSSLGEVTKEKQDHVDQVEAGFAFEDLMKGNEENPSDPEDEGEGWDFDSLF
jgi:hypothetical protein